VRNRLTLNLEDALAMTDDASTLFVEESLSAT
jgi:hypothetical protein